MTDVTDTDTDPADDPDASDANDPDGPAEASVPVPDAPGEEPAAEPATAPDGPGEDDGSRDLVRYLSWAALGVLGLLTVIATFRFYTSTSRAIGRLVSPEYEPLFQAAFNLVVVLVALAGISLLVRRLVVEG